MNKYRRFKYPFGGETPEEFADARRAYYENVGNSAMQAINTTPVVNSNTITQPIDETSPREYLRQYTERVRPEIERKVNEMNRRPSGNGRIIRNHDKLYDYYKDGDKLYYRKKGGKNWIDISDNDVAQKRINATIARNKRSYGKSNNSSSETVKDNKTYDAGTLNDVVVTGTRRKATSKPSKRKVVNPVTAINNSIFRNLYGNQERVNNVIRQGGAKSYKEYLNTPPAPTGYPKQAVIKQAPPKWRGR